MGSYLSAPMLVFRLGVLPRTCETSCGDGPAGASHGSLGALLFLPPLPRRPAARRTVFFISSYFAVALVSCPALPLYPDTSLVTFHIQSPLAYLGAPGTRCARTGRGGGRGRGRGRGRGEKEAGGKRNNANMGAHYVGKSRAGGRFEWSRDGEFRRRFIRGTLPMGFGVGRKKEHGLLPRSSSSSSLGLGSA